MSVLDAYPWIAQRFQSVKEVSAGRYCSAECPLKCHRSAGLRFWLGNDGRLMFGCWAGCPKLEILRVVGASYRDCFPKGMEALRAHQEIVQRYPYRDENTQLLYETVRFEPGTRGRDKDFRQRRPAPEGGWIWNLEGVRRVLYRLPELLAAPKGEVVFVVAGEKDADALHSIGLLATTNVCGERTEWLESYSQTLAGRDVIVVEDRDTAGRRHACEVRGSLMDYARSLTRLVFPAKDATAFLMGLRANDVTTPAELREYVWGVVEEAAKWQPVEV